MWSCYYHQQALPKGIIGTTHLSYVDFCFYFVLTGVAVTLTNFLFVCSTYLFNTCHFLMSLCACLLSRYMNCSCCFVGLLTDIKELMMATDLSSSSSTMERTGLVFQPLTDYSLVNVLTSVYEALNKNKLVSCVHASICVCIYTCMYACVRVRGYVHM